MTRLVIFDCDGTLVDSQAIITTAMERAFEAVGETPPERAETLGIVGLSLPVAMVRLAPAADDRTRTRLVDAYKQAFVALRSDAAFHEPLYPGARTVLDALAADPGVTVAMATGKSRRGVDAVLDHHSLHGIFASLHCADDGPSKPHPHMVHAAMENALAEAAHTVVIGDTTFDMEMAKAAGVSAIGVSWGYHPLEALEVHADAVIDHFDALPAALDSLLPFVSGTPNGQ
ncbi:MAG: HAD-IA family hydrolase [Pseudomonadota bacterium]